MRRVLSFAASAAAAAAVVAAVWPAGVAWGASPVPYTDPAANGVINLCDANSKPLTGGTLDASPFVLRATASSAAPSDYQGSGQRASLWAYVPVQGQAPSEWSGQILTGATQYTDATAPTTIGSPADTSLALPLQNVPPRWNGLVQLRLIYSIPNRSTSPTGYAATDIMVTGNNWSVVRGGSSQCSTANAVSDESFVPGLLSPTPTFVPTIINGRPNPAAYPHGVPKGSLAPFHNPDDGDSPSAATATPASNPSGAPRPAASAEGGGDQAAGSRTAVTSNPETSLSPAAARAASVASSNGLPGWAITVIVAGALALGALGALLTQRLRRRA